MTVYHVVFHVQLLAKIQLKLLLKSVMLIPNVSKIQLEQVYDLHFTVITNSCSIHLDSVALENTTRTTSFQDNTLIYLTVSFNLSGEFRPFSSCYCKQLILILGGCLPIDDLPCSTVCSNPCKTIHPMCANNPTGVSARNQVTIDGEISCTSFDYCKVLILGVATMATTGLNHVRQGNILTKKSVSDYQRILHGIQQIF